MFFFLDAAPKTKKKHFSTHPTPHAVCVCARTAAPLRTVSLLIGMLIGACNPMVCPIPLFRPNLLEQAWRA